MHRRIAELLDYLRRQNGVLRAAYDEVPSQRRLARPAPERWSAAEVVHHVMLVDRSVARLLRRLSDEARALPRETDSAPVVPTLDLARIIDRAKRQSASEAAQPKNTDANTLWPDFDATVGELEDVIAGADGLAMGAVSAPHPALGTFSGYEWIAFTGAHAARHAAQIREIVRPVPV